MNKHQFKIASLILLLFFYFGFRTIAQKNKTKKPNVVFIMCDDLNDYQGVFGGHPQIKTPNIDKLAATGARFLNAQSNAPVCMPSRNSLFTGVYPHASKDFGWTKRTKHPVLKHNKALMALFQENGYKTLGSGKLIHGNEPDHWEQWGMNRKHNYGPLVLNGEKPGVHPDVPSPYREIGPIDGSFGRLSGADKWIYGWTMEPYNYKSDDDRDLLQDELHAKWAGKKIKELEQQKDGKPFFLGIGFVRPHTPLYAPDKYFDMYPLDKIELDKWLPTDTSDTYLDDNIPAKNKGLRYYRTLVKSYNGDRELAMKTFLQAYMACVTFVDEQIGKVVDAVENSKFKDNTIIVFTSDHGWNMGEKNYLFKNSPWEESARIPLIIKTPEMKKGKAVEQPVSLVDIYPTLVDYCSLKGSNKLNNKAGDLGGFSMLPLFDKSEKTKWQGPNGALTIIGNYGKEIPAEKQNYSYRTKDWRYIIYSNGAEELYNHKKDPYEWENVAFAEENTSVKKELRKEISKIIGINL